MKAEEKSNWEMEGKNGKEALGEERQGRGSQGRGFGGRLEFRKLEVF